MNVVDALAEGLVRLEVDTVFGLVGGGNFALATAMAEQGIDVRATRHESAAVSAADGWARATRRCGVATTTQGPGLTNAMTPLTEASKSRTPLLLLAGDTARTARNQNQDVDQAAFARAAGAVSATLRGPETALEDLATAVQRAQRDRIPVVLSLPLDVQRASASDTRPLQPDDPPSPPAPADAAVARFCDRLVSAERPVVLAGRGAYQADAGGDLQGIGERVGALLATSAVGHGLFVGDPWSVGISGGFASPSAARLLAEADLVLAVGAALNSWTTRSGQLFAEAEVLAVDDDATAIGRHLEVHEAMVADAGLAAAALREELERRAVARTGWRTEAVAAAVADPGWPTESRDIPGVVDPREVMRALDRLLPAQRVVAIDSGHFMGWPAQHLRVTDPGGFVFTQAYQSIGLGLGSAIGAAVARPDRPTLCVTGDGGLAMSLGELETVSRLGLRMVVCVLDDASYAAEVHHFGPMGLPTKLAEFAEVDFAAVARGLGFDAVTVRSIADLDAAAERIADPSPPVLLDCKIDPGVVAPWLAEAFRLGA